MSAGLKTVLEHVRKVAAAEEAGKLADAELMSRFTAARDEAAFAALVKRYGGMVLNVCARVLQNDADAEDAAQATFLVLARKAPSIRKKESVASWLHGVAFRAANNLRKEISRRHARERHVAAAINAPTVEPSWREMKTILHEVIERLPEQLKSPVILCYLEGKTHNEAALQLSCSLTTFRGRLERGRQMLRKKLTERGLTFSDGLLPSLVCASTVPTSFCSSVVEVALTGANGAGLASAHVLSIARGVMHAMFWNKLRVGALVLMLLVVPTGLGWIWLPGPAGGERAQASSSQDKDSGPRVRVNDGTRPGTEPAKEDDPSTSDFGKAVGGLRLQLQLPASRLAKNAPTHFEVVLQNVGESDLNVRLGDALGTWRNYYPVDLRLIVTNRQNKIRTLKYSSLRVAGRLDLFVVPLPVGSTYTLRCAFDNFLDPETGKGLDLSGRECRLAAELTGGFLPTHFNADLKGLSLMSWWQGQVRSNELKFPLPARPNAK